MRYLYLFIWLLSMGITDKANGQSAPQLLWAFSSGNPTPNAGLIQANAVAVDAAGNRYITGKYELTADFDPSSSVMNLTSTYKDLYYNTDSGDVFLAKYSPNGTLLWAKTIGGPDSYYGNDNAMGITADNNGNILITGALGSTFDFDPSEATAIISDNGRSDIFIAKYDTNGNYLWAIAVGSAHIDYVQTITTDNSGQIYIVGHFWLPVDFDPSENTAYLTPSDSPSSFIAKYNANGGYVWAKALDGTGNEQIREITTDGSGQLYITGSFSGTTDFDPSAATANQTALGLNDIFIAKYDANGNYLWAKAMGGTSQESSSAIALNENNQLLVAGNFSGIVDFDPSAATANLTTLIDNNSFIAKYDTTGALIWAKVLDIYNNESYHEIMLNTNESNQILIAGNFTGTGDFGPTAATNNLAAVGETDFFIAKYDSNGNYIWAKTLGGTGTDSVSSLILDNNGNLNITGNFSNEVDFDPSGATQNLNSIGDFDAFIAQYNTNGNFLNVGTIGGYPTGSFAEGENKVALGPTGAIYVAGVFSDTVDFDPSPAKANLISESDDKDIFIAKYTSNGDYLWAKSVRGIQSETMSQTALTTDGNGNVYIAGYFFGTVDFDPSNATAALTSVDFGDLFIAKYDTNGNYLWAKIIRKTDNFIGSNYIKSMDSDANGNLYISGHFQNSLDFDPSAAIATQTSAGFDDFFIAKYDTNGNYLWAKAMGGTWYDKSNAIYLNNLGDIYITGSFSDTVDFDPSPAIVNLEGGGLDGMYFAKYDTNGNFLWVKGITGLDYAESESLVLNGNNQLYLSGKFAGSADFDPSDAVATQTSSGGVANFIAKYDFNGNYLWTKLITGNSLTNINAITLDSAENPLIVGDFGIMYGDMGTTVTFDPTIAAGTFTTTGGRDFFITKYDTDGNYLWAKTVGGPLDDIANSIAINSNNEMIITGSFMLTTDFDPSEDTLNLTSINSSDIFLGKYKECSPTPVTVTLLGNALTATTPADAYQWVDCGNNNAPVPGATQASFTPVTSGNYAAVITVNSCRSISPCQTVLSINSSLARSVKLYPNPSSGIFRVTLPFAYEKTKIRVTDPTGKIINQWDFRAQSEFDIPLEKAANGMYFIHFQCDDETAAFKVIKN